MARQPGAAGAHPRPDRRQHHPGAQAAPERPRGAPARARRARGHLGGGPARRRLELRPVRDGDALRPRDAPGHRDPRHLAPPPAPARKGVQRADPRAHVERRAHDRARPAGEYHEPAGRGDPGPAGGLHRQRRPPRPALAPGRYAVRDAPHGPRRRPRRDAAGAARPLARGLHLPRPRRRAGAARCGARVRGPHGAEGARGSEAPGGADAAAHARRRAHRGRDQEPARVHQHLRRADRRALRGPRLPQALLLGGPARRATTGRGVRETRCPRDRG